MDSEHRPRSSVCFVHLILLRGEGDWEMKCAGISSGIAVIRMECYVKLATIKNHFKLLSFYLAPTTPGLLSHTHSIEIPGSCEILTKPIACSIAIILGL